MSPKRFPKWGAATIILVVAITLIVVAIVRLRMYADRYRLDTRRMDAWISYGGVWQLDHGVFHNNSEDRGSKLMGGSTTWSDILFSADIRMDQGGGDAGLVLRSTNEDLGVDAYNGYYVGIRGWEGTLIAGRSNYSWSEVQPAVMPGGVRGGIWYHLTVAMVGCRLGVSARNLSTGQSAALSLQEDNCARSGRVGMRSVSSGAMWRNLKVAPATAADLNGILRAAGAEQHPLPLTTEAAYAKHFAQTSRSNRTRRSHGDTSPVALHLGDLMELRSNAPRHVTARGVVTLTEPNLYIEDSSGGALVKATQSPALNVGEGVEVSGDVHPLLYSAIISNATLRVISTGVPAPPLSVTPWQAASGAYDARFIEIEGHLTREPHLENGYEVLELSEGGETFRALSPQGSGQALDSLRVNSLLRLRGVCTLGTTYTQDLIPFLVFLRSADDVQVLQDPPWWTPRHVALLVVLVLALAFLIQFAYFRFEQWKKDAILRERERIAHDIHDTMAQSFAGIGYQLQGLRTSIVRNASVPRDVIAAQLAAASDLVSRCHADASHTIELLGAASPEEAGDLLGMLGESVYKLSGGDILVSREEQGDVQPLSIRIRSVLFNIGQEAISNAITHGHPNSILLTIRYEKRTATMMIADDGHGFDASPEEEGFGILGMRHRAKEIGGSIEILSAPGVGTRVGVTFPLPRTRFVQWVRGLLRRLRPRPHAIPEPE